MTSTLGVLAVFFIIAVLPKVPWYVKAILQIVVGAVIYNAFGDSFFELPVSEDATLTELFGGNGGEDRFNPLSMGVVGTVLGLILTVVVTVIGKLMGKSNKEDE